MNNNREMIDKAIEWLDARLKGHYRGYESYTPPLEDILTEYAEHYHKEKMDELMDAVDRGYENWAADQAPDQKGTPADYIKATIKEI